MKKQAEALVKRAVEKHGEMKNRKCRPPLNQLILSLLYRLTSVRRATRALRGLKKSFVDWNEVRITHPGEVATTISSAPWAQQAAEELVWLLRELHKEHNCMNLDFLHDLTSTQARTCLQGLVSRDLADEVLLHSLRVPVLPCSEHTARMCHRLGLLADQRKTIKNQRRLAKRFDETYYAPLHLLLSDVAQSICLPGEPDCDHCPMQKTCPA